MRILLLLLCAFHYLHAQNFVVNGSFERAREIPGWGQVELLPCNFTSSPEAFNRTVEAWHTFNLVTPDIFLSDTNVVCEKHLPHPRTGNRMLGLIMYLPGTDGTHDYDYHEYVEGRLARPLIPGKKYNVSFWVQDSKAAGAAHLKGLGGGNVKSEPVNCGNFGFYFATEPSSDKEDIRMSIFNYGMKPQVNFKEIITSNGAWKRYSAVFVPDRAFRYFVFGNFFSDGVTPTDLPEERHHNIDAFNARQGDDWQKIIRVAYYCFDDFAVTEAADTQAVVVKRTPSAAEKFIVEKKLTLSAKVLFDHDKADLKPDAAPELDTIVQVLKKRVKIAVEIGGHTDNTGSATYNQNLSERRAAAVRGYFMAKGIDGNRLTTKGYGDTIPITDNSTPDKRAENRRVELKIIH